MQSSEERAAAAEGEPETGGGGPSSVAVVHATKSRGGAAGGAGRTGMTHPGAMERSAQQKQVIRWEKFLPRRSLRVLLVEHDDSTRHIVTALLRKCSYHVAAVADGLKAWDVLKDKNYNFDLVLTEVEMPSLSGIGLLSKIMGSELSKTIPVIMMSTHDSVGVVFKCMLNGAVDFLVKPVRKNELQNLWQHIWRRHCSTSYANGPENINNNQTISENMSDNNGASNHVSANAGDGSKTGESYDKGSDTQSSGSKPVMEIESLQMHDESLLAEDRSSSRVMVANSEQPDNDLATLSIASKMHDGGETKDKSVEIEVNITCSIQDTAITEKSQERAHFCDRSLYRGKNLVCSSANVDPGSFGQNFMQNEPSDFIRSVANGQCNYAVLENDARRDNALCEATKSSNAMNTCSVESLPSRELSLRRPELNGCVKQGWDILNHSDASAFSRYGRAGICLSNQKSGSSPSTLCIRTREHDSKYQSHFSSHGIGNEKYAPSDPNGRLRSSQGNEGDAIIFRQVSSGSNNDDANPFASGPSREDACVGHSSNMDNTAFPYPQFGLMSLPIPVGTIPFQSFCAGYGPILQPIYHPQPSVPQHGSAAIEQAKDLFCSDQPGHQDSHLIGDLQSIAFHCCEDNRQPCHLSLGTRDKLVNSQSGDPRIFTGANVEQTDQSGSCGRDIFAGSGETVDAAVNARTVVDGGNESGFWNRTGNGLDCDRSRREAALIKFRLKRKERCFEKKVRYHSRKMLAEQRPRVKGQFVRQAVVGSTTEASR